MTDHKIMDAIKDRIDERKEERAAEEKKAKIDAAQKNVDDCQTKLTKANDAAVKAHSDLMNAQLELTKVQ